MKDNPLAAIEFVLFIGFVVWLFLWQRRSSSAETREDGKETGRDDAAGDGSGP
ncbi:MAG: hypothetical protein K9M02_21015 [Thiohalocapsa sp.]|jgi:hypothetical protein|nr:hypothetical protein [Thiohalocapsa sp.]